MLLLNRLHKVFILRNYVAEVWLPYGGSFVDTSYIKFKKVNVAIKKIRN